MTFASLEREERVTVDIDLRARAEEADVGFPGLAVVEVKQPRLDNRTEAILLLRERGLRERGLRERRAGKDPVGAT